MSWMKVEYATPDKPEMFAVASRLQRDRDVVFSRWFRLWRWADENVAADGLARGVRLADLSDIAGVQGIAEAFAAEGWLAECDKGVQFKDFEKHNGKSAKTRAQAAGRQAKRRNQDVTEMSRPERDESVTRARAEQEQPRPKADAIANAGAGELGLLAGAIAAMTAVGIRPKVAEALARGGVTADEVHEDVVIVSADRTVRQPVAVLVARLRDRHGIRLPKGKELTGDVRAFGRHIASLQQNLKVGA